MLKHIIITQKAELGSTLTENYIERGFEPFTLENNLVKAVMGPKRAGKSFFCLHTLSRQGNFGYVNFENNIHSKQSIWKHSIFFSSLCRYHSP
jgi:hypothetical protein